MSELERDMEHLDENNPKHMALMMRKMKDLMPPGAMPKELDVAIKRLEAGEDGPPSSYIEGLRVRRDFCLRLNLRLSLHSFQGVHRSC